MSCKSPIPLMSVVLSEVTLRICLESLKEHIASISLRDFFTALLPGRLLAGLRSLLSSGDNKFKGNIKFRKNVHDRHLMWLSGYASGEYYGKD